jgi:hypothetical protein
MMAAARFWSGEGRWTLTGGCLTPHCRSTQQDYIFCDKFASYQHWIDAIGWCLDAPAHVARGGIESFDLGGTEPTLFASERRP